MKIWGIKLSSNYRSTIVKKSNFDLFYGYYFTILLLSFPLREWMVIEEKHFTFKKNTGTLI